MGKNKGAKGGQQKQQHNQMKHAQRQMQKMESEISKLSDKYYEGSSENVEVALKFDAGNNSILVDKDPLLTLTNKLNELSPEQQQLVKEAMYEFMQCVSSALTERAKDTLSIINRFNQVA